MTGYADSYCGIYCGACSVLRHGETGRGDAFVACLGSVPKEEIACGGCKSDRVYAGCRVCGFRDCAIRKGIAHCVECAEYPCKMYGKWQSAVRLLPHVSEAPPSLELIRREGFEVWVEAQKKRWSCPYCGEPFSWYARACSQCGRSVSENAYRMGGVRRLLCRIILPWVYRKGRSMPQPGTTRSA
jgi:hypothetical protein